MMLSLSGQEGHQVHTEWQVPGTQSLDVSNSKLYYDLKVSL